MLVKLYYDPMSDIIYEYYPTRGECHTDLGDYIVVTIMKPFRFWKLMGKL